MKIFPMRFILTGVVLLAAVSCHHTAQASLPNLSDGAVIEAIQVAGNRAVPIAAIVAKIQTKVGDKINAGAIKRDLDGGGVRSIAQRHGLARLPERQTVWWFRYVCSRASLCRNVPSSYRSQYCPYAHSFSEILQVFADCLHVPLHVGSGEFGVQGRVVSRGRRNAASLPCKRHL